MMVSRLLKSCATPPVSCPTASIFCAWRSCSSASRRRAWSREPFCDVIDELVGADPFDPRISQRVVLHLVEAPVALRIAELCGLRELLARERAAPDRPDRAPGAREHGRAGRACCRPTLGLTP